MAFDNQNSLWVRIRKWTQSCCVSAILRVTNIALAAMEVCTRLRQNADKPTNILVLRTAALGDFILSVPALHRLRAAFPAAKITLLTTASTHRTTLQTVESYAGGQSPWLELLPIKLIDEVLVFSGHSSINLMPWKNKILGNRNFDACFILNEGIGLTLSGTAKKIIFLRASGIRCRIFGIRVRAYPRLFPLVQVGANRLEHHVLALIRSVEECSHVANTINSAVRFQLNIPLEATAWAQALLARHDCDTNDVIVVAPGSRLEFKKWPASGYIRLIAEILEKSKFHVFVVGSGPEIDPVSEVIAGCANTQNAQRIHDLSGQTSIAQLAALLNRTTLFIGNDGGTCHLAAAVGCKVVSISNGGEIPNSVEPWDNQRFTARFDVPCAPCYCFTHCHKNNNRCVTGIAPELVADLVASALNESDYERAIKPH
jgi:ADP-heptose:LPS heptosyltransferase